MKANPLSEPVVQAPNDDLQLGVPPTTYNRIQFAGQFCTRVVAPRSPDTQGDGFEHIVGSVRFLRLEMPNGTKCAENCG